MSTSFAFAALTPAQDYRPSPEALGLSHEADRDGTDGSGAQPRSVRRRDGGHDAATGDEAGAVQPVSPREDGDTFDVINSSSGFSGTFEIAIGEAFSGPLPPINVLRGYDEIVPGAAKALINAHVRGQNARTDAITRLTRAEAWSVITGSFGAQILTVGGLAAAVVLIVFGYGWQSIAAVIPAILAASAQVIAARRKNSDQTGRSASDSRS